MFTSLIQLRHFVRFLGKANCCFSFPPCILQGRDSIEETLLLWLQLLSKTTMTPRKINKKGRSFFSCRPGKPCGLTYDNKISFNRKQEFVYFSPLSFDAAPPEDQTCIIKCLVSKCGNSVVVVLVSPPSFLRGEKE